MQRRMTWHLLQNNATDHDACQETKACARDVHSPREANKMHMRHDVAIIFPARMMWVAVGLERMCFCPGVHACNTRTQYRAFG